MLKWMKLKNLALVDEAEIEFGPSFNVISGETGAGKSVIMGAVGLLLGARADKSSIRSGCSRCEIAAEFAIGEKSMTPELKTLLGESEAVDEVDPGMILIRRVITPSSTRNFINSSPVPLQTLRALGERLVDIHAANENQSLLRSSEQLHALDRFASADSLLAETARAWERLSVLREEKEAFLASMPSAEEVEAMRGDVAEIEAAAPRPGEDEELKARHLLASNSRQMLEILSSAAAALEESEDSLRDRLLDLRRLLSSLERLDPAGASVFPERCRDLAEQISSLASELRDYGASVELDEASFLAMEERMRTLQSLKRRYGASLEEVLSRLEELRRTVDAFDNADSLRRDFYRREKMLAAEYQDSAGRLSAARQEAAGRLLAQLSSETLKLGFKKAAFDIQFEPSEPGPGGFDRIRILFSANPGVPLRALSEVASSGEISRVMLAMKTVLAEADSIPVLIFDEIDANIGGETAAKVGSELASLAKFKQVICISHLPQVACCASTHFRVCKTSSSGASGGMTVSSISPVSGADRVEEIARMLGGGEAALAHARAMLEKADSKSDSNS